MFDVSAQAGDAEGAIGVSVLVALSDLQARNDFNGTLEAGGNATLEAKVDTQSNHHEAAVMLGDENKIVATLEEKIGEAGEDPTELLQAKTKDGIKELLKKLVEKGEEEEGEKGGSEQSKGFLDELGAAGALAYINHDNQALLTLGGQAKVKAGQDASLNAEVTDLLDSTVSSVISDKKNADKPFDFSTESTGKKNGVGVAILISNQDNDAVLTVRPGAELDAMQALSLNARTSLPWLDQSRLSNLIKAFSADNLSDFLQTINEGQMFSTWVNAATAVSGEGAQDSGTTLSGMVDINHVGLNAKVDVADGVNINQDLAYRGQEQTVDIEARTESQMVNVAADPGLFNNEGGKNGFGAGLIAGIYNNSAQATVGAVNLYASELNVNAVTDVDILNYAVAGSKGGTNALSGSISVSVLDNTTRAGIDDGANLVVSDENGGSGDINIGARDETDSLTITGGVVKSTSKAAGVAVGVHAFDRTTEAWLGSRETQLAAGSVAASGGLKVGASADGRIGNYALSVALTAPPAPSTQPAAQSREGTGSFGINISGSAAVNTLDNLVRARITDNLDIDAGAVNVQASDDTALHAIAGGAAVSSNTGNGVGLAGAYTQNTVDALVEAELAATGDVTARRLDITADNEASALSISAGVSASASASSYQVAGSVSVNAIDSTTRARLADGAIDAVDGVNVSARDDSSIHAVAGAASFGGKAGVGAGLSINSIDGATEAVADDLRRLDSAAGLTLDASSDADLVSVAAAMGYSNKYAFDGAVAINQLDHDTLAALRSHGLNLGGALAVDAGNTSSIWTASGSAAIGNDGAMGPASATTPSATASALEILDSDAEAASIAVQANQQSDINALVAGGAVAARSSAVAGSIAINTIDNRTSARTDDSSLTSHGSLLVNAQDASRIRSLTGALAYGGQGAGIGIAGSYNQIAGAVYAGINGGNLQAGDLVRVSALRNQQLQSLAAGAAVGNNVGVAGSVAVNMVGGATLAEIGDGAQVHSDGSLLLTARSDSDIETVAGALGVGLSGVGLAGAVAVNQLEGTTTARVTGASTHLGADGQGASRAIDNGQLNGNMGSDLRDRTLQESINGIGVVASSTDEIDTVSVSVGGGSSVGVAGAVTVTGWAVPPWPRSAAPPRQRRRHPGRRLPPHPRHHRQRCRRGRRHRRGRRVHHHQHPRPRHPGPGRQRHPRQRRRHRRQRPRHP